MPTIGVYLIYAAVVVRTAVVVSREPDFAAVMALLAGYGLLLIGKTWWVRQNSLSPKSQIAYLFVQSVVVIAALILSSYEDFLAMLFLPLSLDAVYFFGRRNGFITIATLSLAMIGTLLFSDVGPLFGLAMGILYCGICFLVGGYAYQVQKAKAAHDQNEQMLSELQTAHRRLQGYADQIANLAIEHERNRLARELHDSVTQTVFSMNLAAQSANLLLEEEPARAAGQLLRIEELASGALKEIQSLVSQLKPRSIMEDSLPTALRRLAAEQKVRHGLEISLEIDEERRLSEPVSMGLYAIAHEALINVSKHSGQCEAIVRVMLRRKHACLEIEDHGWGFDPARGMEQRGHLGLPGMFERAREIGWHLSVLSRPGQGTCIRVTENSTGDSE
ncbi:MAG TPA: sensor histidine kinase [Anaerolineales bacterium]|nr:sensor histidine kinase [Anaerolineales bacterium]